MVKIEKKRHLEETPNTSDALSEDAKVKKLKAGPTEKIPIKEELLEHLEKDIKVIQDFIHSKIDDKLEAERVFSNIIKETVKVRYKDGFGSEDFIPWKYTYDKLQEILKVNHDWPSEEEEGWHQATAELAFLLNGKSYLYEDYSTEEFSQSADYIYTHLMGLTQQSE